MSDLAAIVEWQGRPLDPADLDRMIAGFGDGGTQDGPHGRQISGSVGLLACAGRDPAGPVPLFGGRGALAFDGWLDNRGDLADRLALDRQTREGLSDAALAALSVERWGLDAFGHWVGEFAAIFRDDIEARVVAVRHQFGYRPLCYAETARRLVIASAPGAILALNTEPVRLNRRKLADILCQVFSDGDSSYFEGIRRVPPGHCLIARAGQVSLHCYYRLEDNIQPVRYRRDTEYVEAAHEKLGTALDAALCRGRTVGAFMSGGFDSATTAALTARKLADRGTVLETFTSVPEPGWIGQTGQNTYGDETPFVRAIAGLYPNMRLNLVDAAGLGYRHRQDDLLRGAQVPLRNVLNAIWFHEILNRARARGIGVMIDGSMGNLTLSHDGNGVLRTLLRQGRPGPLVREILAHGATPGQVVHTLRRHLIAPTLASALPDWAWRLQRRARGRTVDPDGWLHHAAAVPAFAAEMAVKARAEAAGVDLSGRPDTRLRGGLLALIRRQVMPENGDALRGWSRLYGIEIRDPYADRRLLEWSLGVPENQYQRDGTPRWLIRRMMTGLLPDSVLYKTAEFGLQMPDWHLRLSRDMPRIQKDLSRLAADDDIRGMINLDSLHDLLKTWSDISANDMRHPHYIAGKVILPLALHVGRFIVLAKRNFAR